MSKSIQERQEEVNREIDETYSSLHAARDAQSELQEKIDAQQADRSRFSLLSEISDLLEQLQKQGGAELFWGEGYDRADADKQIERVRHTVLTYDGHYAELMDEKRELEERIASLAAKANVLNEQSTTLEEVAEEAKHDFVIEREMVKSAYRKLIMPWYGNPEDERRYHKILTVAAVLSIILSIMVPLYEVPVPERFVPVEVPERLAQLVVEKKPPPPPPPKQEEKKPDDPKKPTKQKKQADTKKTTAARKKASSAGLMAFKNNFSGMINTGPKGALGAKARISSAGATAKKSSRSILTSQAKGGSGGISTSGLSRDVGGAGKGIEGVAFSRVETSIGTDFFGEERPLSDGVGPSRTDEEIQIVFDRYKAALYRIYNRELRNNPTLQGKMVLRLTIAPDGKVTKCSVESSDMDSPTLDANIVKRVLAFNFGPKEGVPAVTILYPIDFLPSS